MVTKGSNDLHFSDHHSTVTVEDGKTVIIDNNVKRNGFVYNSKVNPMCIEALMAKHSPRGRAVMCKTPVVYSRMFVASDSAVRVSSRSDRNVKPNVNPVGGANASCSNVKQMIDKDKRVQQIVAGSHANVNPNCDNINDWQGSEDIVSPTGQSVTMVTDSVRTRGMHAPDVSKLTAEVISAPGVETNVGQDCKDGKVTAKIMSAPEDQSEYKFNTVADMKGKNRHQREESVQSRLLPLYDVNSTGVEDKFVNSILHMHQFSTRGILV